MKTPRTAVGLALSLSLCWPGFADLTNPQVPDFRGGESTAYAGWADWSAVTAGVAAPDDPASSPLFPGATTSEGPSFAAVTGGVACFGSLPFTQMQIGYTAAPAAGPISEVVLQIAAPNQANWSVALGYTGTQIPGLEYVEAVETVDLAPDERLYRFRPRAKGPGVGALQPFDDFTVYLGSSWAMCVDEVQIDVRYALQGELAATCSSTANSISLVAGLDAGGSSVALDNDVTLTASGVPAAAFGMFLTSATPGFTACPGGCGFNEGNLCLGGTIARILPVVAAGGDLAFSTSLDLTALPYTPPVAVTAGQTWYFQGWYRDQNPAPTSNTTSSFGIQFL